MKRDVLRSQNFVHDAAEFILGHARAALAERDQFRILSVGTARVEPAFERRAFASDIMTWNYTSAERLAQHLKHDQGFVPWMAQRGINGFCYIRHAQDTMLRIEELIKPSLLSSM